MKQVSFKQFLPSYYQKDLEELLFFHPSQHKYKNAIDFNLLNFGEIRLSVMNDIIIVSLSEVKARTLFIFDSPMNDATLLGSAIYLLEDRSVVLVHLAVIAECMENNYYQSEMITYRLLEKLRSLYNGNRYEVILLPYLKKKITIKNRVVSIIE